ncbi:MAG TPA: hypothetical protein VF120_04850 [Ktedonobacterales bacterium]
MEAMHCQDGGQGFEGAAAPTADDRSPYRFSAREWCELLMLRRRYQQSHDVFGEVELAHLQFLRWLHNGGKLES